LNETKIIFTFPFGYYYVIRMKDELSLLRRAIALAKKSIKDGGGPFGAVIAREGEIISEANNIVVISHDPTAHAEILAIRKASAALKTHSLSDCVIYCSCEPCPMCLGAIYWSGIGKVVYSADRKDAASAGFNDSHIYDEIILNPSDRKVAFVRITDSGGKEVFKEWDEYEGKTPY
jgi:guanine deaminase